MRRSKKVPIAKEEYKITYGVLLNKKGSYGGYNCEKVCPTLDDAIEWGNKYIHLGSVRIEERAVRLVKELPYEPNCK